MSAEKVLLSLLGASTAVTGLVSTRIYLDTRPEADALPAIVFELVSDKQDNSVVGEQEKCTARYQVNCMDRSAKSAALVREAARTACHQFSGTTGGVDVISCLQSGAGADSYDSLVDIYNKPIDFVIHYWR